MKEEYLLTISVPTYNGSKTIGRMLEVMLPQCTPEVEVIISDNASTDNTSDVIRGFLEKYPFIKYIRNEKNIGPDSNFLQCMDLAKGKYTLLLSDDDILLEGAMSKIVSLLKTKADISLVYLNAVGFHERYVDVQHCEQYGRAIYDNKLFVTKDKKVFMSYAGRMWGFLSCFICLTDAFKSIKDVDAFKKTNWLQSYIHILCSCYGDGNLGVISTPYIGAGIYCIISNFDSGRVDGVSYRDMLDFAIAHGFDKKQLDELYIWRICFLSKRTVIKERAAGVKKTDVKTIIKCTWRYPEAWIKLYPFLLLPGFACRIIVAMNNRVKKYSEEVHVNRSGDVEG